jgi:predicted phage terminase large subunit-like protein
VRDRLSPGGVAALIGNVAAQDGPGVMVGLEQEPGASGKADVQALIRGLPGYNVRAARKSVSKEIAAKPLSAQAEVGNVKVVRGAWNETFFNVLESFPNGAHDDDVDSATGGYNMLVDGKLRWLPPKRSTPQAKPEQQRSNENKIAFFPVIRQLRR